MMQLSDFELGWLIGLVEADGSFVCDGKNAAVVVKMTDLDTVQRFATLMRATVNGPYHYEGQQLGDKPYFMSKITGSRARQFMASTAHQFSLRRREKIKSILGDQCDLLGE